MPPWLTILLIAADAAVLLLALLSYRLFRTACVPRSVRDADAYYQTLIQKAGTDVAADIRRAIDAFLADPGEEIHIQSDDGLTLRGHYIAAHPESKRVLLMCHGWNSSPAHDFSPALSYFHSLGFNTLLIWQRAQNGNEGKYMTFGAWEHRDVHRWVDYLCGRLGEDAHIVIHGISMGASTVMLAAGEPLPPQVKGVIADSGYDSAVEELLHLGRRFRMPVRPLLPLINIWTRLLARFSLYDTDTKAALARSELPILFVHGTGDTFVPHECTIRNAAVCRGEKTVVLVEGAAHGFSYLCDTARCQDALRVFLQSVATDPSDKE